MLVNAWRTSGSSSPVRRPSRSFAWTARLIVSLRLMRATSALESSPSKPLSWNSRPCGARTTQTDHTHFHHRDGAEYAKLSSCWTEPNFELEVLGQRRTTLCS